MSFATSGASAAVDRNERPCCPSGVCRRSIARRFFGVARRAAAVPAGCIDRGGGAPFSASAWTGATEGRSVDRRAVWRIRAHRGHTQNPTTRPFRNRPSAKSSPFQPPARQTFVRRTTRAPRRSANHRAAATGLISRAIAPPPRSSNPPLTRIYAKLVNYFFFFYFSSPAYSSSAPSPRPSPPCPSPLSVALPFRLASARTPGRAVRARIPFKPPHREPRRKGSFFAHFRPPNPRATR